MSLKAWLYNAKQLLTVPFATSSIALGGVLGKKEHCQNRDSKIWELLESSFLLMELLVLDFDIFYHGAKV